MGRLPPWDGLFASLERACVLEGSVFVGVELCVYCVERGHICVRFVSVCVGVYVTDKFTLICAHT